MTALEPVTLITGASSGIGLELARVFAKHGHRVALVARSASKLNDLAASIAGDYGAKPYVMAADLGIREGPACLAAAMANQNIEPEILVNCAGFGIRGLACDIAIADQMAMIDLNIRTLTDLSLRWIDSFARHRGGILNVSSIAGFFPRPGMAVYHASKSYVLSLSEALHAEFAPYGIRVSALCPGPVATPFMMRARIPDGHFPRFLYRSAGRVAEEGYRGFIAGKRVIIPGSHNRLAAWLGRVAPRRLYLGLSANRLDEAARSGTHSAL